MKKLLLSILIIVNLIPHTLGAQEGEMLRNQENILKAKVLQVVSEEVRKFEGTDVENKFQTLEVELLGEERAGEIITLENDYLTFKKGDTLYLRETIRYGDGSIVYTVHDKYRMPAIYFFLGLFIVCVLLFGGIQGVRGLASLIGSVLLILFVLMPGILRGYSPILITIGVSSLIIILGSYITHGFNRTTSSAVVGMIATVVVTGILGYIAVQWAGLSGFESEEAVFLNWNTGGSIDFVGLLFGGIMIGLLGVLYDVAIGQAISVEELRNAGDHMTKPHVLKRAIRIGKEHTGALVNTLAIAYVGASLPLLLLFYGNTEGSLVEIVNREVFSTEIIRILIGSIGLVIAVPITTLISVFMLMGKDRKPSGMTHHHHSH